MSMECVVVDAGSRYGLHPTWAELRGTAEFHLFEMDTHEADRLKQKYSGEPGIQVYPLALYSRDTELRFRVNRHEALSSLFQSNDQLLRDNEYMLREFEVTEERTSQARSIDSLFSDRSIHFLKLDVEGAELEVLRGATKKLQTTILGVRSEVLFAPIFRDAAMFGDLHELMLEQGFELLNLDYTGGGNKAGRFTLPGRYGRLLSSDAVWVVGNDRAFASTGTVRAENVIRLALFMMLNSATDQAIDLLVRAVTREGVSFAAYTNDPIFVALHRKALLLFKSLLSLPMLEESDITSTYKLIFGRDFPLMNRFYQDAMFE